MKVFLMYQDRDFELDGKLPSNEEALIQDLELNALFNAIEKSCSTDYDDIVNALRTEYVATPLGIIRFDGSGDAIGVGFSMYQVQNGVFVEMK